MNHANNRIPEVDVNALFTDRWSPRSFKPDPIPPNQVQGLFEAARWSPSCFNVQPWYFLYTTSAEDRAVFLDLLVEKNQLWAKDAPLLVFVLCKRNFTHNGKPNRHAVFDAGAAWMSLALQARMLGLYAHGMAGFKYDEVFDVLRVPRAEYDVIAAVAVGYRNDEAALHEDFQSQEEPNGRQPLVEMISEGGFSVAVKDD
jgi:nitroreductase